MFPLLFEEQLVPHVLLDRYTFFEFLDIQAATDSIPER